MKVSMTGIDFHTAGVEKREQYALTKEKAGKLGAFFVERGLAAGCVILATCNRTEIWFSHPKASAYSLLFQGLRFLDGEEEGKTIQEDDAEFFRERSGMIAVRYLMELGCGIHSQIFGEDQILSQLKQAMTAAREGHYIDSVLETLFRQSVTAAKRVKTSVRLTPEIRSVPGEAIGMLRRFMSDFRGKKALVIGNGEMGRLTAQLLKNEGAKVTMTLRQYKNFDAVIPDGVHVILYQDRYQYLSDMDIVISATRSPHYTLTEEDMLPIYPTFSREAYYIDLAVPRDMDPRIGQWKGIHLLDMDQLGIGVVCDPVNLEKAKGIIEEQMEEFKRWYTCRKAMPDISIVGDRVAQLTEAKLTRVFQAIPLEGEEEIKLRENVKLAVEKSMTRLLLGMREQMDSHVFALSLNALLKSAASMEAQAMGECAAALPLGDGKETGENNTQQSIVLSI